MLEELPQRRVCGWHAADFHDEAKAEAFREKLRLIEHQPWECNSSQHLEQLNDQVREALCECFPKPRVPVRRAGISAEACACIQARA